jgi:hypothetical protein
MTPRRQICLAGYSPPGTGTLLMSWKYFSLWFDVFNWQASSAEEGKKAMVEGEVIANSIMF